MFFIYYQSSPNFSPADFFQSCIPWSSPALFSASFHQLSVSRSILFDAAPLCKPRHLSPGALTYFCCLSVRKEITDCSRSREGNFFALTSGDCISVCIHRVCDVLDERHIHVVFLFLCFHLGLVSNI